MSRTEPENKPQSLAPPIVFEEPTPIPIVGIGVLGALVWWCIRSWSWTRIFTTVACVGIGFVFLSLWTLDEYDYQEEEKVDENSTHSKEKSTKTTMTPQDIVDAMMAIPVHKSNKNEDSFTNTEDDKVLIFTTGLLQLAKQYQNQNQYQNNGDATTSLALLCQQASYTALQHFPNHTAVVTAAVTLLTLILQPPASSSSSSSDTSTSTTATTTTTATTVTRSNPSNNKVLERHLQDPDVYGFDVVLDCLCAALDRAKQLEQNVDDVDDDDETLLQDLAELHRKSCLWLGTLSSIAERLIIHSNGMQVLLSIVDWYPCHVDVMTWALWALFQWCSECPPTAKPALVQSHGVAQILYALHQCTNSVPVTRHGLALLVDVLRVDDPSSESTTIMASYSAAARQEALTWNIHSIVLEACQCHVTVPDIVWMSQTLLVLTQYSGPMPSSPSQQQQQ